MRDDTENLTAELHQISQQIYAIKGLIDRETNPEKKKQLEKDLKQLQYQALFYIDKLRN